MKKNIVLLGFFTASILFTANSYGKNIDYNGVNKQIETWFANGASILILEEIAGYAQKTTFGWYNADDKNKLRQMFEGSDSPGAKKEIVLNSAKPIGFYIDPNGVAANRRYSQHSLNVGSGLVGLAGLQRKRNKK